MKRAPVKEKPAVAVINNKRQDRVCVIEGCGQIIPRNARKYCGNTCRNKGMSLQTINPGEYPGRKSQYKDEFATTIFDEFIKWCDEKSEPTLIPTENSYILIYNARIPTVDRFAEFLYDFKHIKKRVQPRTLIDSWSQIHPEFAEALDLMHSIQKTRLMENGSANRFSPQMAKMILSVNHGMHEKTEVDNTHKMIGILKHVYQKADQLERETRKQDNEQITGGIQQ